MEAKKGYYSLVQFCPDRSRMEAVNIGVLLCVPEAMFIKGKITTNHDRVRRFWDGSVDLSWLKLVEESVEERLEVSKASLVDLQEFGRYILTRSNQILLTGPRPVKVFEPEDDLGKLFAELVDVAGYGNPRARHAGVAAGRGAGSAEAKDFLKIVLDVPAFARENV